MDLIVSWLIFKRTGPIQWCMQVKYAVLFRNCIPGHVISHDLLVSQYLVIFEPINMTALCFQVTKMYF